ncbi:hypothetical protein L0E83_02210 [Marichromatium gracile]|uniref:Uncharacterized protein n=1 Tax=Marichromatium gracile TaxID=1048 RepID=A0A4R4AHM3_MARGR|nr:MULTISPECIES: hypothetical protein [Marichromatium]MBO8085807.1 hypothetical protein [Marichromatium sp.]MBK1708367.1 hypothetical protein [Marichromatium gracile]MCF1182247.1 hypothetical protein [Marichromatium gracile]RNE89532.1 hypothetical protein EBL84_11245 [Marichromatium sp. AB31]RNE92998.1 hypothetical protein EBL85_09100 [Marichromatium sp. AB32]
MAYRKSDAQTQTRHRRRLQIARLEADLAYFQARLELLRAPRSANQLAQRKAFKMLAEVLAQRIRRARQKVKEGR